MKIPSSKGGVGPITVGLFLRLNLAPARQIPTMQFQDPQHLPTRFGFVWYFSTSQLTELTVRQTSPNHYSRNRAVADWSAAPLSGFDRHSVSREREVGMCAIYDARSAGASRQRPRCPRRDPRSRMRFRKTPAR